LRQGEKLIYVFMPTLASLLLNAERSKGAPLTYEEVIAVRDKATCVMVPEGVAAQIEEKRGYSDIDPENCWEEWNTLRPELVGGEGEA
jgi:hypothetical protein